MKTITSELSPASRRRPCFSRFFTVALRISGVQVEKLSLTLWLEATSPAAYSLSDNASVSPVTVKKRLLEISKKLQGLVALDGRVGL